jgi:uncharacterized membrane protein
MTKLLISSLLFAAASQADIIKCNFTEPFVNSTYSMTQSTLSYVNADGKKQVVKNVSFQIKSPSLFELVSKDGKVLQTLNLNNQGSDGMSDRLYPYDAKDNSLITHQGYGGCESNYLK